MIKLWNSFKEKCFIRKDWKIFLRNYWEGEGILHWSPRGEAVPSLSSQTSASALTSWTLWWSLTQATHKRLPGKGSRDARKMSFCNKKCKCKFILFYFIIYKIDREYYEYKTTQNPRSMDLSHCSKEKV